MNREHATAGMIQRLIDGDLPGGEAGDLRAHIVACVECSRLERQMRSFDAAMRSLPLTPAPAGLAGAVMSRLSLSAPAPRALRFLTWVACQAGLFLLLCLVTGALALAGLIPPGGSGEGLSGDLMRLVDRFFTSGGTLLAGWLAEISHAGHAGPLLIVASASAILLLVALIDRIFTGRPSPGTR